MAGMDRDLINQLDSELSIKRIINDIQSDFIYAPHYSIIYSKVGDELWEILSSELRNGNYQPSLPLTIEVPKPSGLSRPGSILTPFDRLAYQISIDNIATKAEALVNRASVFSNKLLDVDESGLMFEPARDCYQRFKSAMIEQCNSEKHSHVIKADISSYFERLYQHNIVNLLRSTNCNPSLVNFIELILSMFTQKDSHGIIQGVYPSDFLGNIYLCTLDSEHEIRGIQYLRYVDDMYLYFGSELSARRHMIELCTLLRKDGLNLNNSKTGIHAVDKIVGRETEVDRLFTMAWDEASHALSRNDFYNSTLPWDCYYDDYEPVASESDINLRATENLFSCQDVSAEYRDKIEKMCLSIFTAANSNYALDYVISNYSKNIHMAQIYAKYLKKMIEQDSCISERIETILKSSNEMFDYQLMWLYAALMASKELNISSVDSAINHLRDYSRSKTLRAVCAIIIGKYGDPTRKRLLKNHYSSEPSDYVQSAVLYSARYFPTSERNSCYLAWGSHSMINSLIVKAIKN